MSAVRGLRCDGCGDTITWTQPRGGRFLLKSEQEQVARQRGWQAPDKLGRHLCWNCRRPEGRDSWRRRANVAAGLPAGFGLGRCTCAETSDESCHKDGHPGVIPLYPGHRLLKGTDYG